MPDHNAAQSATRFAIGSIIVALVVITLKFIAWRITGSVALFSDALESVVNLVAAAAALWAVRVSAIPADETHNFGHHKAEYLSAVFEGVLVVVAALLILHEAATTLLAGAELNREGLGTGLAINIFAAAINGFWALMLIRAGRRLLSPALSADGKHLFSDVITSVGVVVGLLLALWTGWAILDPVMAAIVAFNVLWQGWLVISQSVQGLMDRAPDARELETLKSAIQDNMDGALEYHDLKTRVAGRATFVDFHLIVPGAMSVEASHQICDRIEAGIRKHFPGAVIQAHVEPEHKAKGHLA